MKSAKLTPQAFVAMELVEGESLSARLASGGLPAEDTQRYRHAGGGCPGARARARSRTHRTSRAATQ